MYADLVGDSDPLVLMAETPARIDRLVRPWTRNELERTYAPGKWTAAQLIVHLAQIELASGNRVRFALTTPGYVVQPWDVDDWMAMEGEADPYVALDAFLTLRQFNLSLYRRLSPERRHRIFSHPELIALSIDCILRTVAGHDLHHLRHLEQAVPPSDGRS